MYGSVSGVRKRGEGGERRVCLPLSVLSGNWKFYQVRIAYVILY